jgi:serine/threonine-protein phosphatase 2A regulatory subunit B
MSEDPIEWKFVQSFGDDNSSDDDLVTAVEFDESGNYIAVGDKAGRICIFEGHQLSQNNGNKSLTQLFSSSGSSSSSNTKSSSSSLEYKFYTEFQSHEPEFDCLKSLEIEEKINMIKWGKQSNSGLYLLACNDKTIKYWKVAEKKMKRTQRMGSGINNVTVNSLRLSGNSFNTGVSTGNEVVQLPRLQHYQTITTASPKRVFANAHGYHINSISINSDCETFLSSDDLRINLWNLHVPNESFNIVDVKPPNLEELTEVITSAAFHPSHCNYMIYSSSRGSIRLADLRESALCDQHAKLFEVEDDPASKSFFSEIISSVNDAKFTPDGRFILSRDYLTLKVWDINMETRPLAVITIHDYLKVHLCDLYENDCIFDKFECASSQDGLRYVTGSYNNNFIVHHLPSASSVTIEAMKDPPKRKGGKGVKEKKYTGKSGKDEELSPSPNVNLMDFGKKALHVGYHPSANVLAIAGLNKLYIYSGSVASL